MKRKTITALFVVILLSAAAAVQHNFGWIPGTVKVSADAELHNEGTGMYTDPSVAAQSSVFALNPEGVTCAVGMTDANGQGSPFQMMMYSVGSHTYVVNPVTRTITATGKMRSITRVGPVIVEDAIHDFIAVGWDNQPSRPQPNRADRYETHAITPFWNTTNPLCTASDRIPGGCRFGGQLVLGDISVDPF